MLENILLFKLTSKKFELMSSMKKEDSRIKLVQTKVNDVNSNKKCDFVEDYEISYGFLKMVFYSFTENEVQRPEAFCLAFLLNQKVDGFEIFVKNLGFQFSQYGFHRNDHIIDELWNIIEQEKSGSIDIPIQDKKFPLLLEWDRYIPNASEAF